MNSLSTFVKVGQADDVPPGGMRTFEVDGKPVLVINLEGEYHAMAALCTHQEWDLSEGAPEDRKVVCAGHGVVWDPATGKAEFGELLEDALLYGVKIEGGNLLLGAPPTPSRERGASDEPSRGLTAAEVMGA